MTTTSPTDAPKGIILTQRGWYPSQVEWSHPSGTATFEVRTGDINNAYAVALDMASWLDNGARPWAADIDSVAVKTREVSNRVDIYFEFTGSNVTFNYANGEDNWDLKFGVIGLGVNGVPADHSCAADFGLANWARQDRLPGVRSRAASHRMGLAGFAPKRPSCEAWTDVAHAAAMNAALINAADPRSAYVYDDHTETWVNVAVDKIAMSHHVDDYKLVRIGVDLIAGVTMVG